MIGCLPLDQKSGQLNQGSFSPFHLADKIYGNEGVLLTFGVQPLSFRVRVDESAHRLGFEAMAANMSAISNVIANAHSGVLSHTHAHTVMQEHTRVCTMTRIYTHKIATHAEIHTLLQSNTAEHKPTQRQRFHGDDLISYM